MKKLLSSFAAALAASLLAGCATTPTYVDPTSSGGLTRDLEAADFLAAAQKMVDSMLDNANLNAVLSEQFAVKRPSIEIHAIKAELYTMHAPVENINNAIKARVVNSGKFRVVNKNAVKAGVWDEQDDAFTDAAQKKRLGTMTSADYVLTGRLVEQRTAGGRTKRSDYMLTMSLVNRTTGEEDWVGEDLVSKMSKRPGLGW